MIGPQLQDTIMEDAEMEEDDARSEATFSFTIQNFSKLKESILSPACYVRNLPWKIMAMPRMNTSSGSEKAQKNLGFFLQCNGESDSTSWSCFATAELRMLCHKSNSKAYTKKIKHTFYSKENDWGFTNFISWNEILDTERGYLKDDSITLEVYVSADAPHGVAWDSKKHAGYVGLKNQGATCYMNSLLQTLYFTNELRKAVYKMPTEFDDSSTSVALALQRVFHELQFSDNPVGTKKLTKSFGWDTLDSFMQHDIQEFLRVLLDNIENKMKHTCVEGIVPKLFEGKMISYIKCKNVDYTSTRMEAFYDIQINIKGKKDIYESFKDYIAKETLEGDNKYDAEEYGLQDAEKGVIFSSFPPVLHLHLMRFHYDPITDSSLKYNDRFEFYENISLDDFLAKPDPRNPADYTLHAVLVHAGDNHGGHYVVFINPKGDGKWCKFDDDVVSKCTKQEAIDHNFGGHDEEDITVKHCTNAYMLVYIRNSQLSRILQEVTEETDIPSELTDRLAEEKRIEQIRRKERTDENLYLTINVLLEDAFDGHQGHDLYDQDRGQYRVFKLLRKKTVAEMMEYLADSFRYPREQIRLWPFAQRKNQTFRPTFFDLESNIDKMIYSIVENANPWYIFLELIPPDCGQSRLDNFKHSDILLFFKYYDPKHKQLFYCGHFYMSYNIKFIDIMPMLNNWAGLPSDTRLCLYEEVRSNTIERISNLNGIFADVLEEACHGDIIIFEKEEKSDSYDLPTCVDYFNDLHFRVEVTFLDKSIPNDLGFTLHLNQKITYHQLAKAVAQRVNTDPYLLQFFKSQNYRDGPGNPLKYTFEGTLKDLFGYCSPKSPKKIFYQRLSIQINELENKKQINCVWVDRQCKEEKELTLYPNKNGTITDLLEEAKKLVKLSDDGSGQLRLVEISSNKVSMGPKEDLPLESLNVVEYSRSTKVLRIEEIPKDELYLADDEQLIPCAHFHNEAYTTFGIPFFIKIKHGELFKNVKERIQNKLAVPENEWEKYKFAICSVGKPQFISNEDYVNLDDFKPISNRQVSCLKPFLGLEHINKAPKRPRLNYLEKAIKIYN